MPDLPAALTITDVPTGASVLSAPVRNNFNATKVAVDALIAALSGGTAGQILTATDTDTVAWASPKILYRKNTTKTVVSSVAATDLLNGEITVAANALAATGILRFTAWGTYIQNAAAAQNSIRFALLLGGTTLVDTSALAGTSAQNAQALDWRVSATILAQNATNVQFVQLDADFLAVAAASAAATFATGTGLVRQEAAIGGYAFAHAQGHNSGAKDMTASQALVLNATLPINSASCSITLNGALVEVI